MAGGLRIPLNLDVHESANLLGATALVADLALAGVTRAAGVSASGAAALVVLSAFQHLSVADLGRRVDLTQFAAARMVDSLEADGLVELRPSRGRWVSVRLTKAGRQAARRVLAARAAPLTEVVAALDDDDQVALAGLLASRDLPAIHRARPGGTRFRHLAIVAGRPCRHIHHPSACDVVPGRLRLLRHALAAAATGAVAARALVCYMLAIR
jgi:MarR family transcriptional regulator, negative regulator of the multidrug operon emrRAB